jgi:hypothetical protein
VDETRESVNVSVIVAVLGGVSAWPKASVVKESGYKGMYLDDIAYVNLDYITFAGSFEHGH